MNYMWRVTKYNPVNRNEKGVYLLDEWTSFSDIGKLFYGNKLTIYEYEKYEKAYIDTILEFMACNEIENLKVLELEKYDEENVDEIINDINDGMILSKEQIKIVAHHILREKIWCKLVFDEIFYVHFGYEFNMYIGCEKKCKKTIRQVEDNNMFVESIKSPYLD